MLPFFILERHLSYTAAAGLVLAQALSSSIVQPVFGVLTDRRPAAWLLPAGVALGGAGLAVAALAPGYVLVWVAIAASGIGIAAFHPEGARYANYASAGRASGMSVFSVGGNAGFAAGPLIATPILLLLGLKGAWAVSLIPVAAAAALAAGLPRISAHHPPARPAPAAGGTPEARADDWPNFGKVAATSGLRSILFYGLNTFVPLYWIGVLGQSKAIAGTALGLFLAAGVVGTVLGGRLADRHPWRTVMAAGTALSVPLLLLLLVVRNPVLAEALLVPLAIAMYLPGAVLVVAGQSFLPSRVGTASGVTLGLGVSLGGLMAPLVGRVADTRGLTAALLVLVAAPVLATAILLTLPRTLATPGR